ncbi:MAG TPA: hypothetical protein VK254_01305 [Candidatus Bathyarchaeia archaeon]|nr:hypothetical protein [Candidatus Bathyarchaeia archaeon]
MREKKILAFLTLAAFFLGGLSEGAQAKKSYRATRSFTVSGDQTNPDATITSIGGISSTDYFYRQADFPGLKMDDPFSMRVFLKNDPTDGFEEESWSSWDRYFVTAGNLWLYYGSNNTWGGNTTYSDYATGDYRYSSYFGGVQKKKRKHGVFKTYSFHPTGDNTDADADIVPYDYAPNSHYYYRKVAVPELMMSNLADFRVFKKESTYEGFSAQSWMPVMDDYFITDGYLYMTYGYKNGNSNFVPMNDTNFRVFVYNDGKKKKNKLKKQYVKMYNFSTPASESGADKVAFFSGDGFTSTSYYKKQAVSGARMANFPNIQVMKKNNFPSGFSEESWSPLNYTMTDGNIWIEYGYKMDEDPFTDSGVGDYRIFRYR